MVLTVVIMNSAARLVPNARKRCHITPILKDLHWIPVTCRIEFKILLIVFKCLHGLAPSYLSDLINIKQHAHCTRSSKGLTLEIPYVKHQTLAARSFGYAGPKLWNSLPQDIRCEETVDRFKERLKTFMFKRSYDS